MAVILFPTNNEMNRFFNSRFKGGPLCTNPEWLNRKIIHEELGKLAKEEDEILTEIEHTVLLISDRVEELIKNLPFSEIIKAYNHENSFTNWRDRGHFIRLCLKMLNKEIDEDIISIMTIVELFYLSFLITDEVFDNAVGCEDKPSFWMSLGLDKEEAQNCAIAVAQIFHGTVVRIIANIVSKRNLGVEVFQNMIGAFAKMQDETHYAFYNDVHLIDIDEFYKNKSNFDRQNLISVQITEYFNQIECLWGSHFEAGIILACSLFSDIEENKVKSLAITGRLWGQMLKLRDDILDLVGDRTGLGREPFEDIVITDNKKVRIKKTLPLLLFIDKLKKEEIEQLKNNLAEFRREANNYEKKTKKQKDEYNESARTIRIMFNDNVKESRKHLEKIASRIISNLETFDDNPGKESLMKLTRIITRIKY